MRVKVPAKELKRHLVERLRRRPPLVIPSRGPIRLPVKMSLDVSFLGELGYLAMSVLGAFERFIKARPKYKIVVRTFPDYGDILRHMFPDNIVGIVPYTDNDLALLRECFYTRDGGSAELLNKVRSFTSGSESIEWVFRKAGPGELSTTGFFGLSSGIVAIFGGKLSYKLSKPIIVGPQEKRDTIAVFPRSRINGPASAFRDCSQKQWDIIMSTIKNDPELSKCTIINVGSKTESKHLDSSVVNVDSMLDRINVMNTCRGMISTYSGLGQLAQLCNCNVFYLKPHNDWSPGAFEDLTYLGSKLGFAYEYEIESNPALLTDFLKLSRTEGTK